MNTGYYLETERTCEKCNTTVKGRRLKIDAKTTTKPHIMKCAGCNLWKCYQNDLINCYFRTCFVCSKELCNDCSYTKVACSKECYMKWKAC